MTWTVLMVIVFQTILKCRILCYDASPVIYILVGRSLFTGEMQGCNIWCILAMETLSALLALFWGNSLVIGELPAYRPVTRSFDVFFDVRLNKWFSKQYREAGDLRRHRAHYDVTVMIYSFISGEGDVHPGWVSDDTGNGWGVRGLVQVTRKRPVTTQPPSVPVTTQPSYVTWSDDTAGPWFNIKMSYRYRKSHCGDKTVVRSYYLHDGISYTDKTSYWYWIGLLTVKTTDDDIFTRLPTNTLAKWT